MTLEEIENEVWTIWHDQMTLDEIVVTMGVVYGDIARVARNRPANAEADLLREFGNLIVSTVRWCRHLGLNPVEAVQAGLAAQREWVSRHPLEQS